MPGTLVIAEHVRGEVRDVTFELVAAAREHGDPVTVAVVASDPEPLASRVDVAGVDEVVIVRSEQAEYAADAYVQATEALVRERRPSLVLCGFTVNGMGFAPAVAARLDLGFASDVLAFRREDGGVLAERELYEGKVRAELAFPGSETVLLMLRPTTWSPAEGTGPATITEVPVALSSRMRHLDYIDAEDGDGGVDITKADFILTIGRGIGDEESISSYEELAERMGATLGVSRPLVDAGWAPASRQVGQSGKTVKPKVYLALGVSGAVQHLAGMKESGRIIAVNSDPEAAIFSVAHFGAVADVHDLAEELEKLY
jgi:electron transfer flavoprotein alpha subunit